MWREREEREKEREKEGKKGRRREGQAKWYAGFIQKYADCAL